jgi:hypothetical protein
MRLTLVLVLSLLLLALPAHASRQADTSRMTIRVISKKPTSAGDLFVERSAFAHHPGLRETPVA